MVVDDNSRRANLLKEELNSKNYQVDIFLGSENYKKALEALETYSVDSPCIVIANERLGLISGGGRTGLLGEYAESGLLFCYGLMKAYPSIVKATMVIAAIKGYSTLHGFYNVGALREVVNSLGIRLHHKADKQQKHFMCCQEDRKSIRDRSARGEGSATTAIIHGHNRTDSA